MGYNEKTDIELINDAMFSSDIKTLYRLLDSNNLNVRRALARNKNINSAIANELLFDPVLNVSYLASLNPNITKQRKFDKDTLTPCVICSEDERKLDCINCQYSK